MPQDKKNDIINNYLQSLIPSDAGISASGPQQNYNLLSSNLQIGPMSQEAKIQTAISKLPKSYDFTPAGGAFGVAGDVVPFSSPYKNLIVPTGMELTKFGKLSLAFRKALQEHWPEGLPDEISKNIREHGRYLAEIKPNNVSNDLINKATAYTDYIKNREALRNANLPAPSIAFWKPKVTDEIIGKIIKFFKPE